MTDETLNFGPLQADFQRDLDALDGIRGRELTARRLDLQEKYNRELARVREVAQAYGLPDDLAAAMRRELDTLPNGGRGFQYSVQRHNLEKRYQAQAQERGNNAYINATAANLGVTRPDLERLVLEAEQAERGKMAELRAAYKAELAKIPRGWTVAVSDLQARYRAAGLDV